MSFPRSACNGGAVVPASPIAAAERTVAAVDYLLMQRIAARDVCALAELYDRHSALLFSLLLRMLRDRGDAEDAMQEVLIRVWQKAERYDPALGSAQAWLLRVARNFAVDRLRARRARCHGDHETLLADVPGAIAGPEEQAICGQSRAVMTHALTALEHDQRILIEHAFYDGYTQSELAEQFQLPLGTVKTRIRRGMQVLRAQLLETDAPTYLARLNDNPPAGQTRSGMHPRTTSP